MRRRGGAGGDMGLEVGGGVGCLMDEVLMLSGCAIVCCWSSECNWLELATGNRKPCKDPSKIVRGVQL